MFTRSSLNLLKSAAKSDAAAQRAFALAQAAQTKANKARELASVAEAKELILELSKAEVAARLTQTNAASAYMASVTDRNSAWSAYEATKKNEEVTMAALTRSDADLTAAEDAATAERDLIKTTE
jgi:hypothetical protein